MAKRLTFLLGIVLISLLVAETAQAQVLKRGMRAGEIAKIQEILKTDPEIYPEGLVTGYFGFLTEKAIKRLQEKCKLPQTGVIDEPTRECIWPVKYSVNVLSPNGGEVWDRNKIQTIEWEVIFPPERFESQPFFHKVSIDLHKKLYTAWGRKEEPFTVFIKHIGVADLFNRAYSWKVTPDVKNGDKYVIRISILGEMWTMEREISLKPESSIRSIPWPIPKPIWDESDDVFTITGEVGPSEPAQPDIEKAIKFLKEAIIKINQALEILQSFLIKIEKD